MTTIIFCSLLGLGVGSIILMLLLDVLKLREQNAILLSLIDPMKSYKDQPPGEMMLPSNVIALRKNTKDKGFRF